MRILSGSNQKQQELVNRLGGGTSSAEEIDNSVKESSSFNRNTIVLDGDSIAAQNNSATGGSSRGALEWGNVFLNQRLELLANFGSGGERTDEVLARISTTLEVDSKYVHYIVGKNDILQLINYEVIIANLRAIYTQTLATGKIVIASTIIPSLTDSVAQQSLTIKVNKWITDRATEFDNYIVVDYYSAVVDVTTNLAKVDYTRDGVHPSVIGAFEMGVKFKEALENVVPIVYNFTGSNVLDDTQIVDNSMLLGGVNIANNWSIADADSTSKEVLSSGNELQVINSISESTSAYMFQSIYDGFSVGDEVSAVIEFDITDVIALDRVMGELVVRDASTILYTQTALFIEGAESIRFPNKTFKGTMKIPKFIVPTGAIRLIPYFWVGINGTAKVNSIQIINHSNL